MFLADGSFWQVGLVSEEGARMDNAEASNSAASPLPAQRKRGRSIPVPIPPLGCGYHFHKYKRKAASRDLNLGMGQRSDPDLEHRKGWADCPSPGIPGYLFWKVRESQATSRRAAPVLISAV